MAKKSSSANAYKQRIKKQMKQLGTYSSDFELLIDTLAETCHLRDVNLKEWDAWTEETGYRMAFPYTNKGGSTNMTTVPFYNNNIKFNELILKYTKELGLSPLTLEKAIINDDEDDPLDEFLKKNSE